MLGLETGMGEGQESRDDEKHDELSGNSRYIIEYWHRTAC
jgi:hypothetical protein